MRHLFASAFTAYVLSSSPAWAAQIQFPRAPQSMVECEQAEEMAMRAVQAEHDAGAALIARREQVGRERQAACRQMVGSPNNGYWRCIEPYDKVAGQIHERVAQHFQERDRLKSIVRTANQQCRQVAAVHEREREQAKAREAEQMRRQREQMAQQETARRAAERENEERVRQADAQHQRVLAARTQEAERQQREATARQAEQQRERQQQELAAAAAMREKISTAVRVTQAAAAAITAAHSRPVIPDVPRPDNGPTAVRGVVAVGVQEGVLRPATSAVVDATVAKRNNANDERVSTAFAAADAVGAANGAVNPVVRAFSDEAMRRAKSMAQQAVGDMNALDATIRGLESGAPPPSARPSPSIGRSPAPSGNTGGSHTANPFDELDSVALVECSPPFDPQGAKRKYSAQQTVEYQGRRYQCREGAWVEAR